MLTLKGLNVFFGGIQVLWDVSLAVNAGETVTLIGPNGAGKSTLLRTILGIIHPRSGVIELNGKRIDRLAPHHRVERGLVYVPEGRRVFPQMTTYENLELGAIGRRAKRDKTKNLQMVYDLFPILRERRWQLAGTLSGGEMQMLSIGRGLMGGPALLMIDEPSFGLAPIMVRRIFDAMRLINERGVTILLVEQNVVQALKQSTRGYVLENGHIAIEGKAEKLLEHEHVKRAYLGM